MLPGAWELSTRRRVAPGWIEPHIRYLFARLAPRADALRALAAHATLRLEVGFVGTALDSELPAIEAVRAAPSLSSSTTLARLGIGLDAMSMTRPPPGASGDDEPWRGG